MTENLFEFARSDEQAGFRLNKLEVYNWGTFSGKVWKLNPEGRNSLLTGDIGSGKSTLVDAVTTLLVPANKAAYNKAAGAETKERSLRSYVLGFYKFERSDSGLSSKSVALRDENSFSVILGVFENQGYYQKVTLAQVFWIKDSQSQPERFYVVSDKVLGIKEDFSDFGSDILSLKKKLKNKPSTEVFETFPKYSSCFMRKLGIKSNQALSLFHQTVSMKSVGNLTDFVREHMLEPFDAESKIDELTTHFDDLTRAHGSVIEAKKQIELLSPVILDYKDYQLLEKEENNFKILLESLSPYFSQHKLRFKQEELTSLKKECERVKRQVSSTEEKRKKLSDQRDDIKAEILKNGGDRLEKIDLEIRNLRDLKEKRQDTESRYSKTAEKLGLYIPSTFNEFQNNLDSAEKRYEEILKEVEDITNSRTEKEVLFSSLKSEHQDLEDEIESLLKRKSNINSRQIKIRNRLCSDLGLDEEALPFAGELIRVKEKEKKWEGAAERILHNFGMSLLVEKKNYNRVCEWVDSSDLKGRLVYYLAGKTALAGKKEKDPDSLTEKLEIKRDSLFYNWLENEISKRFDYICCENLESFYKEHFAVTVSGQVKSGGKRHEKDDRKDINDKTSYILGWSNKTKIKLLKEDKEKLESEMQDISEKISELNKKNKKLEDKKNAFIQIKEFRNFSDIDWKEPVKKISELEEEKKELEKGSDVLEKLNQNLKLTEDEIKETENTLSVLRDKLSRNDEKQKSAEKEIERCREDIGNIVFTQEEKESVFSGIDEIFKKEFKDFKLTFDSCIKKENELRKILNNKSDLCRKKIRSTETKIINAMTVYSSKYYFETKEMDISVESAPEYEQILIKLKNDNLPAFEKEFKNLLNENTIREIAKFQSMLNKEQSLIKEKIEIINKSLSDIEYNSGRYIRLEVEKNTDSEIREFQNSLRSCLDNTVTGSDEQYSEAKFLQVKEIIERFKGRTGTADADKRWTKKVTDVRNWFVFGASERWIDDNSEYEHYTDSGGKSGGQKEKLAYTVLAASLAYQFGLEWGEIRSESFRFVAIDEAFGRGSDESTGYSLELFKKLNLQLLIVTPLQKIHVIEPYVSSVGFVHNKDGISSGLKNMTIEEYRKNKEEMKS
ncbi:MAG: ATP-binding protein [Thermodesulfobacteriota bacterium]